MAMVKYTIKTVIRDRKQGAKMNYWTMELEGNLEVDLGVELQTDLHPSGREDGEEVVSLEISSIRLYDVEIELEHLSRVNSSHYVGGRCKWRSGKFKPVSLIWEINYG